MNKTESTLEVIRESEHFGHIKEVLRVLATNGPVHDQAFMVLNKTARSVLYSNELITRYVAPLKPDGGLPRMITKWALTLDGLDVWRMYQKERGHG